jgi:hypothetical protein
MNVGRFCDVLGGDAQATHQRIARYVKRHWGAYGGLSFSPREAWVVEQTMLGLRALIEDVRCTDEERRAITELLDLAAEEQPGTP